MTDKKPDLTGPGFSDRANAAGDTRNIRFRDDSHPTPGDLSAALYGPAIRDRTGDRIEPEPDTAEPAIERSARFWHRAFLTMAAQSGGAVVDGLLMAADAIRAGRCDVASVSHAPTLLRAARRRLENAVRAELGRGGKGDADV